jgi:hypothetical protein
MTGYPANAPTPEDGYAQPPQLPAKFVAFKDPFKGKPRAFHTCLRFSLG